AACGGWGETPGEVVVWDLGTGKPRFALKEPRGVRAVAFAPDGKLLACGDFDNLLKLRDTTTGKGVRTLRGHSGGVNSGAFFPDGKTLASAGLDGTVRLWDVATGQQKRLLSENAEALRVIGLTDVLYSVAVAPDGKTVAACGRDRKARLWDV